MDLLELKRSYPDVGQPVKEVESVQYSVEEDNKQLTEVDRDNVCASYIRGLIIIVYEKLSK